jgi:hypothetical protein
MILSTNIKTMETLKQSGLSAERRTSDNFLNPFFGLLLILLLFLSSCHEKTQGQNPEEKNRISSVTNDSLSKPKVNIKVNKHYDDKGNVIGFDSTYTSFYSNVQGDTARMDSLMGSFDRYFKRDHSMFFDGQFNSLFFDDSTRYPDFFHDDFFMKRYELNDHYLRDMMRRMDSIKNHFYYERSKKEKKQDLSDL